jgi:hypothetical protein
MKLFAYNLLSETLGRQQFLNIDPRDAECKFDLLNLPFIVFTKTLVYLIQREIDLASHPDNNFKSLVQDGLFGTLFLSLTLCLGPGLGNQVMSTEFMKPQEHIMSIEIDL